MSDDKNFKDVRREKKRKQPAKSGGSRSDKIKELRHQRLQLQVELGQTKEAHQKTQTQLAKALRDCNHKQFQLDNMVKDGNGVNPGVVGTLQQELDTFKQDYQTLLTKFQDFKAKGTDEMEDEDKDVTPDYDLPLNLWSKSQLIAGMLEGERDLDTLEAHVAKWKQQVETLQQQLKKSGHSFEAEMNTEMREKLRAILKDVTYHNIKMLWADEPKLMRDFYDCIYGDLRISDRVLEHEEYHGLSQEEMIRVYGVDLWKYFKSLRQSTQTDVMEAVFSKCILRSIL